MFVERIFPVFIFHYFSISWRFAIGWRKAACSVLPNQICLVVLSFWFIAPLAALTIDPRRKNSNWLYFNTYWLLPLHFLARLFQSTSPVCLCSCGWCRFISRNYCTAVHCRRGNKSKGGKMWFEPKSLVKGVSRTNTHFLALQFTVHHWILPSLFLFVCSINHSFISSIMES